MTSDAEDGVSPEPDLADQDGDAGDDSMTEIALKDQARKTESNASSDTPTGQSKSNSKDPQRPRRKKARRACFACQRAHLTCGDERPCQRCIKRGLQDACQDGIRKKAKYLHDAPPEALIPPSLGGTYSLNGTQSSTSQSTPSITQTSAAQPPIYYQPHHSLSVDIYGQQQVTSQQIQHSASGSFGPNTPISPPFNNSVSHAGQMSAPAAPGHAHPPNVQQYPFDPSDPALFNFDISNLNFGNHYGALEFGMLGHLTSSANDPHRNGGEVLTPIGQVPSAYPNNNVPDAQFSFSSDTLGNVDWAQRNPPPPSNAPLDTPHNTPMLSSVDRPEATGPYAYAIGARPNSLASASPISIAQDTPGESSSSPALFTPLSGPSTSPSYPRNLQHNPVQHPAKATDGHAHASMNPSRKRPHDADHIYNFDQQPYPYTAGFHRLLSYIKTHFSKDKIIRIAQALAAIRPPLITFAQHLTDKDLVFMEINVQRKLFAYDDFIKAYGTPTVIARRDGAIVAVSQEFMILTGWSKDVLLGKKPNLNVNTSGSSSTGASTTGTNSARGTRRPSVEPENTAPNTIAGASSTSSGKAAKGSTHQSAISNGPISPKNVLIAEIMSQDTVVEFYEDYAKLAFGDPMGRALRRGKLLKYRTAEESTGETEGGANGHERVKSEGKIKSEDKGGIADEAAFVTLGQKEGVVDCMYMWNVRRDNFEVPQLIVMNFLPVIDPTSP